MKPGQEHSTITYSMVSDKDRMQVVEEGFLTVPLLATLAQIIILINHLVCKHYSIIAIIG